MSVEGRTVEMHKRKFMEFLNADDHQGKYMEDLTHSVREKRRFVLNVNELRSKDVEFVNRIIRNPREHIVALQDAATESAKSFDPSIEKLLVNKEVQIGFTGSFGMNSVTPRGLSARLLNRLVEVEGIVVKCSNVKPKLVKTVHFCPATNEYSVQNFRDATSIDIGIEVKEGAGERLPTTSVFPTKDANDNPLETEAGFCVYKDYQSLVLQEMPEKSRPGQLPRSIDVMLEHDLVDRVKPGDRILCVGVYRSLAASNSIGQSNGIFRSVIVCNNISIIGKEVGAVRLTGNDIINIREISARTDVLDIMSRSLCPSIFGHEFVKKALILQLLGGVEHNLNNGTHLRGDINVMLVGDPSTAKSQLLRAILDIAPLAISTTGRGSSGVGLTAAVTSDPETGERRLEAGAMVLADRGVVCIDEFDKMSENDRVAIHEVMEQQTVTIAKAGIHATLNARCSVLAAANPIYGHYDRLRRPQENIGLPDSLLSRFDLLFIVLDQLDPALDRRLSEHVVKSHQYRRPGTTMEPESLYQGLTSHMHHDNVNDLMLQEGDNYQTPVWQQGGNKENMSNNTSNTTSTTTNTTGNDLFTKEFLRKYIHFAKNRIHPELSDDAMELITTSYANMRSQQTQKNLPITARTLETIIRLASASAKSRLSDEVLVVDVEIAMELINYVMFHEIGTNHHTTPTTTTSTSTTSGKKVDTTQTTSEVLPTTTTDKEDTIEDDSTEMNMEILKKNISSIIQNIEVGTAELYPIQTLIENLKLKSGKNNKNVTQHQVMSVLRSLENQNKIMIDGDDFFVI